MVRCPVCHRPIKPGTLVERAGAVVHVLARSSHALPLGAGALNLMGADVQNSPGRPADRRRPARARVSKRKPSRKGIGGRPLAFIPTLVVVEAARLYQRDRRWTAVLEELRRGGNGTYARNTLIRRVAKYSAVQNSGPAAGGRGPAAARARAAKTRVY